MKWLLIGGFVACVPVANWLIQNVGTTCIPAGPCLVPVGFGLMAPSGVLLIGVAFALRDAVQDIAGRAAVLVCIAAGAALSVVTASPALAVASIVAFVASELVDFLIYDRTRARTWAGAIVLSGLAGAVVDSVLFSLLAFGAVKWAPGLILAKVYASAAFALWVWARRPAIAKKMARGSGRFPRG